MLAVKRRATQWSNACSKSTLKALQQRPWTISSGVIVDFKQVFGHLVNATSEQLCSYILKTRHSIKVLNLHILLL